MKTIEIEVPEDAAIIIIGNDGSELRLPKPDGGEESRVSGAVMVAAAIFTKMRDDTFVSEAVADLMAGMEKDNG